MKTRIIDKRVKEKFLIDDAYLNGYAKSCGWKATLVYMSLCRHAGKDQSSFPSINLMAREHHVSKDTIIDGIKILKDWNVIKVRKEKWKNLAWKNNTYILIDKSEWRPKSDYLVANSDYPSRQQQPDLVANSDIKETHKEGNTLIAEVNSAEWSLENFKKQLEDNARRDLNIIALYWEYKQPSLTNREQAEAELKRCLRPAKSLVPYEDDRLVETMEWLAKNARFKWTLESVLKYITEDLTKIKP